MTEANTPTFTAFEGDRRIATGDLATVRAEALAVLRRGAARVLVFNDDTGDQTDLDFRPARQDGDGGATRLGVGQEVFSSGAGDEASAGNEAGRSRSSAGPNSRTIPSATAGAGLQETAIPPNANRAVESGPGEAEAQGGDTAPRRAGRPRLGVVGREVTLLPRHWEWLAAQPGGASVALRKLVESARKSSKNNDMSRERTEAAYRFMRSLAGNLPDFEEASRALFAGDHAGFARLVESWPADVREYVLTLLKAPAVPVQMV